MKTNEEINKYFTEEVFGGCWHDLNILIEDTPSGWSQYIRCKKCGFLNPNPDKNPDYFSKEGFWDIWEWAIEQKWWNEFAQRHCYILDPGVNRYFAFNLNHINYKTFARILYNFLEDKNDI